MHGADWPTMKEMYGALLPHVEASRRPELPARHDGRRDRGRPLVRARRRHARGAARRNGGLLGADFTIENGRYRIARIYDAESWNPELRAPLAAPGVERRRSATTSLAVNGVELRAPDNIYRLLDGTANRQTVLDGQHAARRWRARGR